MRLPIILLLGTLVGCGASESVSAVAVKQLTGAWTLQSVNGSPLPASSAAGVETLSSRLVADQGSFTITSLVRVVGTSTELTTIQSGSYYCGHAGCAPMLLIFDGSGANVDADVADTTLTLRGPTTSQVYRRE